MLDLDKIKDLSLFLKLPISQIRRMDEKIQHLPGFAKWINIAVEDWNKHKINQQNKDEIVKWFKNNDKYVFELADVHSQNARKKISMTVIGIARKYKVKKILDYGCGIGEDSIEAARAGFMVTMADVPSKTLDFAKWRATHLKLPVKTLVIKNDSPIKEKYDAITCFEVLQHLCNPETIIKHLINHLNPHGLLIVTTRFNNPSYPMALKRNYKYEEGMANFITKNGLSLAQKIYQYGKGSRKKYLFVYVKQE
ncbi:MAG: ubiG [Candidatus Levybacteria bacterium]|nr:ubiG [Candidatus Levybacteria bacterium]